MDATLERSMRKCVICFVMILLLYSTESKNNPGMHVRIKKGDKAESRKESECRIQLCFYTKAIDDSYVLEFTTYKRPSRLGWV